MKLQVSLYHLLHAYRPHQGPLFQYHTDIRQLRRDNSEVTHMTCVYDTNIASETEATTAPVLAIAFDNGRIAFVVCAEPVEAFWESEDEDVEDEDTYLYSELEDTRVCC